MNVFPKTVLWWVPPPCLLRGASSYYINHPWSKRPPLYQARKSSWVIWTWYSLVSQAVGRRPCDPAPRSTADFPCPSCTKVFRTVSRQLQRWKTRLTVTPAQKQGWKSHQYLHTGNGERPRPFSCPFPGCGRTFTQAGIILSASNVRGLFNFTNLRAEI